ncbi:interleukin-27 subunit beta [Synchiropus splendidus]|uniref:interleukin-27 subunit beta n=1 Tax=Synchiropus splendidus TaxID=270530 RepID=UPI00237D7909|nr:interleukin-27 subunit beta [Synchiropus splendidus]
MAAGVCVVLTLVLCAAGCGALDVWTTTESGHPPPSVTCWCSSYPNKTFCSWTQPSNSTPPRYTATYSERLRPSDIKPCQLIAPDSSSPSLWHCHLPDLKLLTDYIVNITAVHSNGSCTHLTSFMVEDIVKPDPPTSIQVSSRNHSNIMVTWSPPPTWANLEIFPLKYEMLYHYDHRGKTWTKRTGPFERTAAELKGLCPGRTYRFQVCAKELLDLGQCSTWSSPVQVTVPSTI